MMSQVLDSSVFPGIQGGPLEHVIAGKAIAFAEAIDEKFMIYAKQVVANARALVKAMIANGFDIVSGGTDNHLMLVDLRNKNVNGKETEKALVKADITCNKNMVPFDDKSPMVTSGIRLGTPALTTRGFTEDDMIEIGTIISMALHNSTNQEVLDEVKSRVATLCEKHPLY